MTLEDGKVPDESTAMDRLSRSEIGQLVVGAYIRVSTVEQGIKGTSVGTQKERCEQVAMEMGLTLDGGAAAEVEPSEMAE